MADDVTHRTDDVTGKACGPRPTASGPGRLLVTVYGIFALAAASRAGVQLATRFHEAPVAYLLSAFSAAVYVVATIALARSGPTARRLAWVAVVTELVGVLVIGTFSVLVPEDFPRATVWSTYGIGYVFIPLVLPFVGILWLRRTGQGSGPCALRGPAPRPAGERGSNHRSKLSVAMSSMPAVSPMSGPALAAVNAFVAHLEASAEGSRALRRQRSWALREAVLFAALRCVRQPAGEGGGGSGGRGGGGAASGSGELTDDERALAVSASGRVALEDLFSETFVDDWLEHADPVLRGVTTRSGATQRARVTSLRALAAFTGASAPQHRHGKPVLRQLLTEPEIASALRALTRPLPGRGPDDHVRLAAVLAVMSVWPARSAELSSLRVTQVRPQGSDLGLAVGADGADGEAPLILRGIAAERVREWLDVRDGLVSALLGGQVHALWVSIRSNSRPGGPRGSLPLPPGMPLKPRGLQRAYARSVVAANAVHLDLPGFPLPRSLDLLRRSIGSTRPETDVTLTAPTGDR